MYGVTGTGSSCSGPENASFERIHKATEVTPILKLASRLLRTAV